MFMAIKIKKLTRNVCKENLKQILQLIKYKREMDGHTYDYWKEEHVLKELPHKWDCSYLAFDKDKLVGFMVCYLKLSDELRLSKIFTSKEYRGLGIGTKFLNKFIDYAKKNNIKKVTTCTAEFNQSMQRLLDKNKFKKTFSWKSFNGVTYYNYERDLSSDGI